MALTTITTNGVETASDWRTPDGSLQHRNRPALVLPHPDRLEMPNLVQVQIESFEWFKREGLRELLEEISPITDHHKKMELTFCEYRFDEPWKRMPERGAGAGQGRSARSSSSSAASATSPTPRRCASRRSCAS